VQSLYLRTLILDLLNTGNLSKIQIEIADGWFSSWCGDYALDSEYSTRQHLFYVDLASESGMHLVRKDSHGDSMRYIRADGLKAQIEEVQAGLRHGRLYAGYGAGAVFPSRSTWPCSRSSRSSTTPSSRAARTASRSERTTRTARSTWRWASTS
jgi:hypothetical protein